MLQAGRQRRLSAAYGGAGQEGSYCKACRSMRDARDYLKRVYGRTPDDVSEMVDAQAGVCSICISASAEHVDHDHATGRVRGVLCFTCNVAIGQFKDDPWLLRRAIAYLDGTLVGPRKVRPGLIEITSGRDGGSEPGLRAERAPVQDRMSGPVDVMDVAALREAVRARAHSPS